MSKVARVSRLKSIREKFGLSPDDLAQRVGVSPLEIKQWERDLSRASANQLRDMAVVLQVTVQSLRGESANSSEDKDFAFDRGLGAAYGTLRLALSKGAVEYPVDEKAREAVLTQLYENGPQDEDKGAWLCFGTMDNLIVFANPDHLYGVDLVSDDAEQMPRFEHPEVYQALEDWDLGGEEYGPVATARCEALLDADGYDAAIQRHRSIRVLSLEGGESWHHVVEPEDLEGIFELELQADMGVARNRFMRTSVEGYHVERFVNLSRAALVEVPANAYLKRGISD